MAFINRWFFQIYLSDLLTMRNFFFFLFLLIYLLYQRVTIAFLKKIIYYSKDISRIFFSDCDKKICNRL